MTFTLWDRSNMTLASFWFEGNQSLGAELWRMLWTDRFLLTRGCVQRYYFLRTSFLNRPFGPDNHLPAHKLYLGRKVLVGLHLIEHVDVLVVAFIPFRRTRFDAWHGLEEALSLLRLRSLANLVDEGS